MDDLDLERITAGYHRRKEELDEQYREIKELRAEVERLREMIYVALHVPNYHEILTLALATKEQKNAREKA